MFRALPEDPRKSPHLQPLSQGLSCNNHSLIILPGKIPSTGLRVRIGWESLSSLPQPGSRGVPSAEGAGQASHWPFLGSSQKPKSLPQRACPKELISKSAFRGAMQPPSHFTEQEPLNHSVTSVKGPWLQLNSKKRRQAGTHLPRSHPSLTPARLHFPSVLDASDVGERHQSTLQISRGPSQSRES